MLATCLLFKSNYCMTVLLPIEMFPPGGRWEGHKTREVEEADKAQGIKETDKAQEDVKVAKSRRTLSKVMRVAAIARVIQLADFPAGTLESSASVSCTHVGVVFQGMQLPLNHPCSCQ